MPFVKLTGTSNPNTNWTSGVVLERNKDGKVTKEVVAGVPVELSANEQKKLEEKYGLVFEKSSKEEADQVAESGQSAGSDIAGAAPVFGDGGNVNQ